MDSKYKILIGLVVLAVLAYIFLAVKKKKTTVPGKKTTAAVALPRQCATITDCGYDNLSRGWYDVQKLGAPNDFCRYVGGGNTRPTFSCALAGSTSQYTPGGAYREADFVRTDMKPGDRCYGRPSGAAPNPCPPPGSA